MNLLYNFVVTNDGSLNFLFYFLFLLTVFTMLRSLVNVACLVWKMMIWSHEKTVSVFQHSAVNGTGLNCIFVVNSRKKKEK